MTGSRNLAESRHQTRHTELEERMLEFATAVIQCLKIGQTIPRSVRDQLIRSATSIGANYAEACNASSKLDFRNKIFIAKKEAAETRYWLNLCARLDQISGWEPLQSECQQLLLILQTIINSLRSKSDSKHYRSSDSK